MSRFFFSKCLTNGAIFFFIHCKLTFTECFAARPIGFCTAVACRHNVRRWTSSRRAAQKCSCFGKSPWEFSTLPNESERWRIKFESIPWKMTEVCQRTVPAASGGTSAYCVFYTLAGHVIESTLRVLGQITAVTLPTRCWKHLVHIDEGASHSHCRYWRFVGGTLVSHLHKSSSRFKMAIWKFAQQIKIIYWVNKKAGAMFPLSHLMVTDEAV